ncbi:hypothetical protein ACJ73_05602 [Blastomyces percursus]|uniref:Uncharacterized protein n=1 Tax=Blastomyces percursus TaxID=1658174 RepID=A0A1J9R4W0_9EURO|nr:hypothetical protein ACJ73_05602 [Blastomyces percursus]
MGLKVYCELRLKVIDQDRSCDRCSMLVLDTDQSAQTSHLLLDKQFDIRDEAGTGTADEHPTPLKRCRRASAGAGAMQSLIAVEVPVIAGRLEADRSLTLQEKTRAQVCRLSGKTVQCVDDDTTMRE